MMGKTHMVVGMAMALAVTTPDTVGGFITAIVGGAVGSSISDIDVNVSKHNKDALYTRLVSTGLVPVALLIDLIFDGGIINYMRECSVVNRVIGVLLFVLMCLFGKFQEHRGFTHSLLALALFSISIALFCLPLLVPFATGYASHLVLDLLNKRSIKLFYPINKGVCFKLCYANKTVDKVLFLLGSVATVVLLVFSLSKM